MEGRYKMKRRIETWSQVMSQETEGFPEELEKIVPTLHRVMGNKKMTYKVEIRLLRFEGSKYR